MIRLILAAALLLTAVSAVHAYSCTTSCQTYGNQTTCQRTCW